jgi:hypothetical protein
MGAQESEWAYCATEGVRGSSPRVGFAFFRLLEPGLSVSRATAIWPFSDMAPSPMSSTSRSSHELKRSTRRCVPIHSEILI